MIEIESAMLIDNNNIDNFINNRILKHYGVTTIKPFMNVSEVLSHFIAVTLNTN